MEYSNRFPFWIYEYSPAGEYDIKPSRMLFGKQRYAICPVGTRVHKRDGHDYKSVEAAVPWLNSVNVYARIWGLFDAGKHGLIKELVKHVLGENDEDLEGYSDRSVMGELVHSRPGDVAAALRAFEGGEIVVAPASRGRVSRGGASLEQFWGASCI